MKIFIGCSTNHIKKRENPDENSVAVKIYNNLNGENAIQVLPWWKDDTIRPGSYFFERLLDLSSICDYGIFILSKESEVSNDKGNGKDYKHISNVNVYIELGMFIAKNGIERTIFILEGDVENPSDFSGIHSTRHDFDRGYSDIINEVQERIRKNESIRKNYVNFKMYINKRTHDRILENDESIQGWKSKSAYIGLDAAKVWSSIETNPNYMLGSFKSKFEKYIQDKVKGVVGDIENIVSLGSGIGTMDQMIVRNISNNALKYIPIELNPYLAYKALDNVLNSTMNSYTSFAIIDDFEEDISQLNDFITNTLVKKEEKSLYTMLGGTFSNIDRPNTFLNEFAKLIDANDFFLIDASIISKEKEYCINEDKNHRLKNIFAKKLCISSIKNKYESGGIFKKSKRVTKFLNLKREDQIKKLFDYVEIENIGDPKIKNVTFLYRFNFSKDANKSKDEASILFKIKRYNYDNLCKKLETHFHLVKIVTSDSDKAEKEKEFRIELNGGISVAYFLLKKKTPQKQNE